ncbi:hypothetical protein GRJ2_001433800 [Grus japonensis]|uniref:Uncharacterized protein n=1 Tax=Grus japonensis TaxID=30415 RepID=A0ABC9WW63_GRUJA
MLDSILHHGSAWDPSLPPRACSPAPRTHPAGAPLPPSPWHCSGKRGARPWKASAVSEVCRWCSAPLRMPCVQDFRSNAPRQRVPSRALVQPRDIGAARTELVVTEGPGAGPVRAVRPRSWKTHQKRPRRCLLGSEEGSDGQDLMAPSGWQPQPPRGDSKAAFPTRCRRGLFARGETRYPAPRLGELSGWGS